MTNDQQLLDLRAKAEQLTSEVDLKPASRATVTELAQIVADLVDIVHSHIYRNDDPGQP